MLRYLLIRIHLLEESMNILPGMKFLFLYPSNDELKPTLSNIYCQFKSTPQNNIKELDFSRRNFRKLLYRYSYPSWPCVRVLMGCCVCIYILSQSTKFEAGSIELFCDRRLWLSIPKRLFSITRLYIYFGGMTYIITQLNKEPDLRFQRVKFICFSINLYQQTLYHIISCKFLFSINSIP